jgi:hypothetical protein
LAPTVGIAATGFCYLGGILQLFHRRYHQIFHRQDQQVFHRQDQQILRLPTAATVRSHLDQSIFIYDDHITSGLFILFGNIGFVVEKVLTGCQPLPRRNYQIASTKSNFHKQQEVTTLTRGSSASQTRHEREKQLSWFQIQVDHMA